MNGNSIIGNIFLVYVVTQLISTAYGLTVIGALKPIIEEKLKDKGYEEKNKNSLYVFNEKAAAILKGFIPFYYGLKGVKLVESKESINRAVDEEIVSGNWLTHDEQRNIFEQTELEKDDESIFKPMSKIQFEKPEPYRARPSDYTLYDTYETPVEYATREMSEDDSLRITPFESNTNISTITHTEVTSKDVAKFIAELSTDELRNLRDKIDSLIKMNESNNYRMLLEKDIA
jgi:hypothetical protein